MSTRTSTSISADKLPEFDFESAHDLFKQEIESALKDQIEKIKLTDELKADLSELNKNELMTHSLQDLHGIQNIKAKLLASSHSTNVISSSSSSDQPTHPGGKVDHLGNFYDKTASFFDKISCESSDITNQIRTGKNWKEERKINAETFGLPAPRVFENSLKGGYMQPRNNNYNNYRNTNNYNNGYSNNYRNGNSYQNNNNYRNNNNNNNNQMQQQQRQTNSYNLRNSNSSQQIRGLNTNGMSSYNNGGYGNYRRYSQEIDLSYSSRNGSMRNNQRRY
jgi:hypothetical protein